MATHLHAKWKLCDDQLNLVCPTLYNLSYPSVIMHLRGCLESLRQVLVPVGVQVCFNFQAITNTPPDFIEPKSPVPKLQWSIIVNKIYHEPAAWWSTSVRGVECWKNKYKRAVRQADFNLSALAEHACTRDHVWSVGQKSRSYRITRPNRYR